MRKAEPWWGEAGCDVVSDVVGDAVDAIASVWVSPIVEASVRAIDVSVFVVWFNSVTSATVVVAVVWFCAENGVFFKDQFEYENYKLYDEKVYT